MVSRSHKKDSLNTMLGILRTLFGLVILFALVYYVSIHDIFKSIGSMNIYFIPFIISLYIIFLVLSTICLQILLKEQIPLKRLFKYYSLSWVFGLILPGKVGEFSFAFLLKKEGFNMIPSFVVFFLDKFITFIFLTGITFLGAFIFFDFRQALFFVAILSFIILLIFSFLNIKVFWVFIPKKYRHHAEEFVNEYHSYLKNDRRKIYLNLIFTCFKWIANSSAIFLIFMSLGITTNLIHILVINTLTALASLIPITINGLGIRQSLGVLLFSKIGVDPAIALSMYLISLSLTYLMAFFLYSYYSFLDGSGVQQ